MSQNENELLDSLLESLSDDQEMEKKIDAFARNKERQRRIQRARETSEQFQQTYSSSTKNQKAEKKPDAAAEQPGQPPLPLEKTADFAGSEENPADSLETGKTQEAQIPDFVSSGAEESTIPLDSLKQALQNQPDLHSGSEIPASGLTMRFDPSVSSAEERYGSQGSSNPGQSDEAGLTRKMPSYEQPDLEATRAVSSSSHPGQTVPVSLDGSTRVFSSRPAQNSAEPGSGTVRVNNDEIRSLLEKDEPLLKREYIKDDEEDFDDYGLDEQPEYQRPRSRRKSGSKSRIYLTIGAAVLGVAVVAGGGFAIKNFIDSSMQATQGNKDYDSLLSWVSDYLNYDEATQKSIVNYRKIYDRLTDEQKQKIDDTLVAATGKTFDELLAAAQKADVPKSSNENVANAEKKAKIKDEIAQLNNEITSLNADLTNANNRINEAKNAYDNAVNAYTAAVNDVNACQNTLDQLTAAYSTLPSEATLQSQISSLQSQVEQMILNPSPSSPSNHPSHDSDSEYDDDSSASTQPGQSDNSSTLAQRQALLEQIDDLKAQLSSAAQTRQDYELQIADAQTALQAAQSKVPEAKSAMDTANGAYQAVKDSAAPIQAQIDEKTAQINELQTELDSIE